jgi:HAD superfamily hydrolase (TIGR01509 family)
MTDKLSPKIRAVAFDMDGLLLNTEDLYGEVGEILMQRRGKSYRDEVRKGMIGLPAPQAYGVLIQAEELTETWQELHEETEEIFAEILESRIGLMPGVEEILTRVEELGLPKCVATSSTQDFAKRALGLVGIYERFDFVITAAEVERGKPHPDIYLESAARMGVQTAEMLVFEDSPMGTRAGVAAGAYVVSVPNEHTIDGDFSQAQWIAETLNDPRLKILLRH